MSANPFPPPIPSDPRSNPAFQAQLQQRQQVFSALVDTLKPWLLETGNWIFGGLIALTLVMLGPLLTIGPASPAILVAFAALVCALPLDVSGLLAVKLTKDFHDLAIDDAMQQAIQAANIPNIPVSSQPLPAAETLDKRRTDAGLRYAVRLVSVSAVLTLLGMVAALWYIAWWVALLFVAMVIVSLILTFFVMGPLIRPVSDEEKEARRREGEQRAREHRNPVQTK